MNLGRRKIEKRFADDCFALESEHLTDRLVDVLHYSLIMNNDSFNRSFPQVPKLGFALA